jgi:type IV pilus assembly protein PilW
MKKPFLDPSSNAAGYSLIELMIALAISTFLILGIVQVFTASKSAYLASEGLARVQESARFALDFLQRDVRMAGHLGCRSDVAYFNQNLLFGREFYSTLVAGGNAPTYGASTVPNSTFPLRFDVGVEGFEFSGTARGDSYDLAALGENPPAAGGFGGWAPAIPAGPLQTALTTGRAVAGSDIIVLRFLSSESVALAGPLARSASPPAPLDRVPVASATLIGGIEAQDLYAVENCRSATVFQASGPLVAGLIPVNLGGLNAAVLAGTYGVEARLHRAESMAYFIGVGTSGRPALKRVRLNDLSGGAPPVEELIEGVENMQFEYGYDDVPATSIPEADTDVFAAADDGVLGGNANPSFRADGWRRVRAVRVSLLVRSDDRAVSPPPAAIAANGVNLTPFADSRVRIVYQTTITLRNRLVGTGA